VSRDAIGASAAHRPDVAPLQSREKARGDLRGALSEESEGEERQGVSAADHRGSWVNRGSELIYQTRKKKKWLRRFPGIENGDSEGGEITYVTRGDRQIMFESSSRNEAVHDGA